MKIDIYDGSSKDGSITLAPCWDNTTEKILHQVMVASLANRRVGLASTKTRGEVKATGKKPWKQKGLGRARAGSYASPIWRGGGVTFGPKPRDFGKVINKKVKTKAYMYVFGQMNEQGKLKVVKDFQVSGLHTKDFLKALGTVTENLKERIVVVTEELDTNMKIGSHNLPNVEYMGVDYINILSMVYAGKIIITQKALKKLDEKFSKIMKAER